jgi:hypothetical protein
MPISQQVLDSLKLATDSVASGIEKFVVMTENIPDCDIDREVAYCRLEASAELLHASGAALADTLETVRRMAVASTEQTVLWYIVFQKHRLEELRQKFQLYRRSFELHREQYLRGMN